MTEPITPALSEAEWEKQAKRTEAKTWKRAQHFALYGMLQQAAALCLYEQPFGFTQEDVELVRSMSFSGRTTPFDLKIHALADKIAALLPPPPE